MRYINVFEVEKKEQYYYCGNIEVYSIKRNYRKNNIFMFLILTFITIILLNSIYKLHSNILFSRVQLPNTMNFQNIKDMPLPLNSIYSNNIFNKYNIPLGIDSNNTQELFKDKSLIFNKNNEEFKKDINWKKSIGNKKIELENGYLLKYDLPDKYYKGIDYSSFQPYMYYQAITNKKSSAYKITRHENAYTDSNGFRRFIIEEEEFKIGNENDYMIALGHYYNEKGIAGERYLIITETGMYTAITGDVKSKSHTDSKNMFSRHGKKYAGIIEWILDNDEGDIDDKILLHGTVSYPSCNMKMLQGKILYIYKICT